MISTFLATHPFVVPFGFWGGSIVVVVLTWALYRRRRHRALLLLAALALVAVLGLTLLPEGRRPGGITCTVQFSTPFQGIDTFANLAMLLPLTVFLGTALRRPLVVLAGVIVLSGVIELLQAVTPALGRRCDTDDVLQNTIGAVLGAVIALVVLGLDRRRAAGRTTG